MGRTEHNDADVVGAIATYGTISALGIAGFHIRTFYYPNGNGKGIGLNKGNENIIRVDWHDIKLGGRTTGEIYNLPHIDMPGRFKHFPWHQVDKWMRGVK
jgi:hypothetical protein